MERGDGWRRRKTKRKRMRKRKRKRNVCGCRSLVIL
jgi:hypothetical protein